MLNWLKRLPMFVQVLGASLIGFWLILQFQPERDPVAEQQLPWNAFFDESGKLHALGLTLDESTLNDAIALYGKDVEMKLFSDLDESNKSIEAYFPVIYIGSIKAALAVSIDAPKEALEKAFSKGKNIVMSSTGGREVELFNADKVPFLSMPIASLTLLPRNHLTERAIEMRFGAPDSREIQSDKLEHLYFNKLGLELIIDPEGPEALQYTTGR